MAEMVGFIPHCVGSAVVRKAKAAGYGASQAPTEAFWQFCMESIYYGIQKSFKNDERLKTTFLEHQSSCRVTLNYMDSY